MDDNAFMLDPIRTIERNPNMPPHEVDRLRWLLAQRQMALPRNTAAAALAGAGMAGLGLAGRALASRLGIGAHAMANVVRPLTNAFMGIGGTAAVGVPILSLSDSATNARAMEMLDKRFPGVPTER